MQDNVNKDWARKLQKENYKKCIFFLKDNVIHINDSKPLTLTKLHTLFSYSKTSFHIMRIFDFFWQDT
jgi:hypothetical protein